MKLRISLLIFSVLLGTGCVIRPQYLAPSFVPPKSVAVLPVLGSADDPRAPAYVRRVLAENLRRRGYPCAPNEKVDQALSAKFGDAVKASSASVESLRAALPDAEAAVTAEFTLYRFEQAGVSLDREVRIKFKMVDLKTGKTLWEEETEDRDDQMNRDQSTVTLGMSPNWFGMGYTPLQQQMYDSVARAVLSLPKTNNLPPKKWLLR